MKEKILSVLLLLVVVSAFSGVASAASHQVLVSEAYDELVLVSGAIAEVSHNITVEDVAAIPAYVEEKLVSPAVPAYDEQVSYRDVQFPANDVNAWVSWIYSHENATGGYGYWTYVPAESHVESQLVSEAYDEDVLVSEGYYQKVVDVPAQDAYDELVSPAVPASSQDYSKDFNNGIAAHNWIHSLVNSGKINSVWDAYTCQHKVCGKWVYTVHWTEYTPAQEAVYIHHDAVAEVSHTEYVEPVYETVHHDAVYEDVTVIDVPAYSLVRGAYTIHHAEVPAVYEYINHDAVPAVTHEEKIIDVPAQDAVYKLVHHDAVYKIVDDPVIPTVSGDDGVVADVPSESVPMQDTGSSPAVAAGIVVAALAVLGGFGLAAVRRDDDEEE